MYRIIGVFYFFFLNDWLSGALGRSVMLFVDVFTVLLDVSEKEEMRIFRSVGM